MDREAGEAYVTLDGSTVRELVRPEAGGSRNLSVAEAVVEAGAATRRHTHGASDEVYYVLEGKGEVWVGENCHAVGPGSCVPIPAGVAHLVRAGQEGLRILCACAPPYTHEDTVLL